MYYFTASIYPLKDIGERSVRVTLRLEEPLSNISKIMNCTEEISRGFTFNRVPPFFNSSFSIEMSVDLKSSGLPLENAPAPEKDRPKYGR